MPYANSTYFRQRLSAKKSTKNVRFTSRCAIKCKELVKKYEEDISRMAGLDRKIEVKIGAKITLRRNIDIGL